MDRGAWWAAVRGVAKSQTWLSDFTFTFNFSLSCIGEGNGNPLQCSCLENPRDGGAWWAAIYGVAESRTRLKRLSSSSSSTHYNMDQFWKHSKWNKREEVAQSCPTLRDSIDYTVHGILQARILKWVVIPFSRGSSQPRDQTQVSRIAGGFFTSWATREAPKWNKADLKGQTLF